MGVLDSKGIITESRPGGFGTDSFKAKFAKTGEQVEKIFGEGTAGEKHSLESVIEHFKPDVLIGTSGVPNTFTEEAIRTMAKYCDKPVIMQFSLPALLLNQSHYQTAKANESVKETTFSFFQ